MLSVETYYHAEKSNQPGYLYLTISQAGKDAYPLRVILFAARGPYIIQVGISLARSAGQLRRLTIGMVLAGLLLLFFASCGGFLIIRRALQPVSRVVTAAQQISTDDLSLRIAAGHRKDEIGALVETFNDMISRLEESVKRIKQFSGDVSHELRTPLTRIRGEVEVLLRHDRKKEEYVATMRSILEEIEIMGRIIEDLLFLSRVEAGKGINWSDQVDLSELLIRACGSRRTHAAEEKLVFSFNPFPGVFIKGDCALLERMLTNIIDNAIRYTAPGGRVDVSLEQEQGQVLLRVSDTGIGIPEAARSSIFDRFFVVDYSRSKESGGVGLGLAIAKSIADLHGAVIEVQSEVGRGSIFTIRFLRN
jgi:heavy metal sensor kinase